MDSYTGDTSWSGQLSKSRRIQPREIQWRSHCCSTSDDFFAVWRRTKKLHRYTFSYSKRNESFLQLMLIAIFDRFLSLITNAETTCTSHFWFLRNYNFEKRQIFNFSSVSCNFCLLLNTGVAFYSWSKQLFIIRRNVWDKSSPVFRNFIMISKFA